MQTQAGREDADRVGMAPGLQSMLSGNGAGFAGVRRLKSPRTPALRLEGLNFFRGAYHTAGFLGGHTQLNKIKFKFSHGSSPQWNFQYARLRRENTFRQHRHNLLDQLTAECTRWPTPSSSLARPK